MADPQDVVAQFIAITDCEATQAEQYLDAHNWDLNAAIDTFMAVENVNSRTTSAAHDSKLGDDDEDGVRAPDEVKRQRLIDPPHAEVAGPYTYAPAYDTRRTATSRSVFATAQAQPDATSARTQRLNDLYRLPTELMFVGDFFQAREAAKSAKKWLLAVIHRDDVFESHVFNRDVWSNASVVDTVNSAFVFWLQHHTAPEGATFIQRYLVDSYPYIAIVDPRTGAKIWSYQGPADAGKFLDKVSEFLTDRPITELYGDEPSTSSAPARSTGSAPTASVVHDLTGDDAPVVSTSSSASSSSPPAPAAAPAAAPAKDNRRKRTVQQLNADAAQQGFSSDDLHDDVLEEPDASTEGTTRIQVRLPGGGRKVRRFRLSDPVRSVVQYILSELPEEFRTNSSKRFDVLTTYPARSLTTLVDRTIEEANIKEESLTVRSIE